MKERRERTAALWRCAFDFINRLKPFVERKDRAALAALSRGLNADTGFTADMHRYLVPLLPNGISRRNEDLFYLVAALYARWHQLASKPAETSKSFGRSLRELSDKITGGASVNPGIEREFIAMLSTTDREDLRVRLRRAVTRMGREGVGVDWVRLLVDLHWWNRGDRRVQRQWAKDFWSAREKIA